MKYQVSENVKSKFDALVKDEKVLKAVEFVKDDNDAIRSEERR